MSVTLGRNKVMNGRFFGGRKVRAGHFPEEQFHKVTFNLRESNSQFATFHSLKVDAAVTLEHDDPYSRKP
jgi:hypothetical protein